MSESQRNFVILISIAVIGSLFFSEQFGLGTGVAGLVLHLLFTVMIVTFLIVLYRRHQGTIAHMPSTPRAVLQASGVVLIFLLLSGIIASFVALPIDIRNPMLYWPALMLCIFGIWWAWQQRTMRW